MSRLSRTSSASSESYTALPSSLESHHHQAGMPSYYHHGRIGSLSGPGVASTNGAVGYYDQLPEGVSTSTAGTLGSNAMAAVASYQQQEPFAVGPPLTLGGNLPGTVVTSNGRRMSRSGARSASANFSVQSTAPGGGGSGRASSSAWTPQDDDALLQARARGENWAQIQMQFPGKTPNACRKRHERLMERRNATNDFDARKMEQLAREYMHMRREMWTPLAQRTGEKWTTVEQKCMNAGLKNLQGVSRSSSRRLRIEQGYVGVGGLPAYAGDENLLGTSMVVGSNGHAHLVAGSGVEGVGGGGGGGEAGSGDNLIDGHGSPGGSTGSNVGTGNRSVSGGSNSSTVSVQTTHHMQAPSRRHAHSHSHSHSHSYSHLQVPSSAGSPSVVPQQEVGSPGATYPDYYTATSTGFSGGAGTVPSTGSGAAMVSPYMGHHQHHGHPAQQQAHHSHRLSPDMGIDALLHRR
ncbi:uncharacterized protein SPSK_09234 [Sporothrix schenckii 1099-18]|uniref:Uncharacterized protein n=2 Tax=Sporothrix schenckii TaxID=29908 RepID=U7Q1C6_SPOS1|nr:uncharacterized protein SPSK_09234 [Sporothrix schenckii 1099-18]ERT00496.1 hypothetical protein HMPREF1624_03869 [Sporothrix schenckii ATCC 58251]KJR85006.1 hypothetical protein SPSK_09234 [Sporothrix schenckii 1099-18]